MHNVKLIRMQSGEDIMASMVEQEDSDIIQLDEPMRLVFRRLPTGQTMMMMMPWLPVELIEEFSANVYATDIVTMVEPKAAMIQYYDKLVARITEDVKDADEILERLLAEQDEPEYEEDDGPLTEDQMEQLLNHVKMNKLH